MRRAALDLIALSVDDIVSAIQRRHEQLRERNDARIERLRLIKRGQPVPAEIEKKARGE